MSAGEIVISIMFLLWTIAGILQWDINRTQVRINKALQDQINRNYETRWEP